MRAKIIDDASMSRIMANVQLLGEPIKDGGLGDEQAMRILLLVATTGRRLSEILLLDRDPLLPLHGIARTAGEEGFVAKLRYQQTKIEDGPDTILIDADTVAVIRAQQEWADREMAARGLAGTRAAIPVHRSANEQRRAPALPGRRPCTVGCASSSSSPTCATTTAACSSSAARTTSATPARPA